MRNGTALRREARPMVSDEGRNPVETELESCSNDCRTLGKSKANLEIELAGSIPVMLSNKAMDGRRVYFNEIDKMGKSSEKQVKKS